LERELVRLGDSVASRLRAHDLAGRTVTLKVRFHDFRTITRSITVADPLDTSMAIVREAKALLAQVDPGPGVRLIGIHVSGLLAGGPRQLRFDDLLEPSEAAGGGWSEAEDAVDEIRARFGDELIGPATLVGPGGMRRKRPGEQQWGPNRVRTHPEPDRGPDSSSRDP
jgi:DNA polymerase-4